MSKRILDTNFVLRYLLKDVPDMFEIACNNIMYGDCSVYPEIIAETALDFADCLLIAYNKCYGYEILTFDKRMMKKLT